MVLSRANGTREPEKLNEPRAKRENKGRRQRVFDVIDALLFAAAGYVVCRIRQDLR